MQLVINWLTKSVFEKCNGLQLYFSSMIKLKIKMTKRNLYWDWFIRASHLLYIILIPLLYLTATSGLMVIHQYLGVSLLTVVLLRVIWGVCGSYSARFSTFLVSPKRALQYSLSFFRRHSQTYPSHNPMGGYMVVTILTLLSVQAGLGLFATDDILFEGPLVFLIDYDLAVTLTTWHHRLFDVILIAITLHIAAVIWYQFYKRQGLIQAMITGRKPEDKTTED